MASTETIAAQRDIDRPLGRDRPNRERPVAPRQRFAGRAAATAIVALLVAGVSGAVALRDRPFRTPVSAAGAEVAATTQPGVEPVAPAGATRTEPAGPGGAAIIKVNPDSDLPAPSGVIVIRDPSAIGQNLRVAHLPDRALIEDSAEGPLPVRSADGRRPMDVYARPWSGARGARIALVIGGVGVSQTGSQYAVERLPPEVTLAFASGGNSLSRWMQTARQRGHEIVLQLPLEPFDFPAVNPGRNTLTVDADGEENIDRLHWSLSRITNYTGVMNYMGARFTADGDAMKPLMAELGQRGLLYLDDGSSARSLAPELALQNGVAHAVGDAAIDGVRERGPILKKLDELERVARAKGSAIGTGSAFDVTVDAVASWIVEARKRGIEIVPVSALVADPERR